jgi:hypothetical protein
MHYLELQAGTTGDNTVIRLNKEIATGSPAICALTTGTPDGTYCYQPAFGGAPERLYYKPTGGLINNKIVYTGGVERIVILAGVSHIHLKSMKLRMAATDLVRVANADGISILDSDLQWSATRGIRILEDSDNGTISNNVIHDVALGLAMQSGTNANNNDNWLISSNVIHAVDQEGYYCDDDSEGIGIQGGSNSVFEYNEIFDTPGVGINFYTAGGQQQQNNRVRFNRIHDIKDLDPDRCGGVGPLSGRQEKGIQFQKSNLTHNPDDSTGNIVHHNILWNIARTGLRSTSQKSADGPTWSFFNNVVYGANVSLEWSEGSGAGLNQPAVVFKNNVLLNPVGANPLHVGQHGYYSSADRSGLDISHNLFYPDGSSGNPLYRWNNVNVDTLANWQSVSGMGQSSLAVDPGFANPAIGDVAPGPTSPTIDVGLDVGINSQDHAGNPVMVAVDLGAYEYGDLAEDLLGYYRMEEIWTGGPNDVVDSTAGTNGRSLNGVATAGTSAFLGSSGGSFSGSSSHSLTFGDSGWQFGAGSYSLSAWVKTTYSGASQRVICKGGSSIGDYSLNVQTNGKAQFFLKDSGGAFRTINGSATVNDGIWHHLVAVVTDRDSLDSAALWVDGAKDGVVQGFYLGAVASSASHQISQLGGPVTGSIDEVAVYTKALAETEIKALFNSGAGIVIDLP